MANAKIKRVKLSTETSARDVYDIGAVRYDENQSGLTEAQESVARGNIGVEDYTESEIQTLWDNN